MADEKDIAGLRRYSITIEGHEPVEYKALSASAARHVAFKRREDRG